LSEVISDSVKGDQKNDNSGQAVAGTMMLHGLRQLKSSKPAGEKQ